MIMIIIKINTIVDYIYHTIPEAAESQNFQNYWSVFQKRNAVYSCGCSDLESAICQVYVKDPRVHMFSIIIEIESMDSNVHVLPIAILFYTMTQRELSEQLWVGRRQGAVKEKDAPARGLGWRTRCCCC